MNPESTRTVNKIYHKKVFKVAIIGFVAILILGGAFFAYNYKLKAASQNSVKVRTAKVVKGNLSLTVSGSGPIASSNRSDVSPKVNGTIVKVYYKEGDAVKAGDLLYELDDSEAKVNVEKAKTSLAQTQLTQSSNSKDLNGLMVSAPFSGQVSNILVKNGDTLNKNAPILTITDQSKLKLTVPFSSADVKSISIGMDATVYLQDFMQSINGKVTYINTASHSTPNGGQLNNVEITVENPGSLREGIKASVEISTSNATKTSTAAASLAYINSTTVKSSVGGTVKNITVKENQFVGSGELLVELQSDETLLNKQSTDIKVSDAQMQLDNAQNQLTYYKIYAPISGTIVKQTAINVGDSAKAGTSMCTIADNAKMQFDIPVDELDIAKVKIGQKANVTIDAISETSSKPLTGVVSKIAVEGTYTNGVTTYPVTISIDKPENLRGGMNANAEIFVTEKKDTLYVPVEAVSKAGQRSFVMVKANGKNAQGTEGSENSSTSKSSGGLAYSGGNSQNGNARRNVTASTDPNNRTAATNNSANSQYYANAVRKPVEVGINNESFIEITSGLNEGDEVILPPTTLGQNNNRTQGASPVGGGTSPLGGGGASFGGVRSR